MQEGQSCEQGKSEAGTGWAGDVHKTRAGLTIHHHFASSFVFSPLCGTVFPRALLADLMLLFSLSVVSDSATPRTAAHQASPILHYLSGFAQTNGHLVSDAIQPSHPLLLPSSPAFNLSQHQGLFPELALLSGDQRIGTSASVLPMNIQG